MLPECFPDASQMVPRWFPDGSQMLPRWFPDGSQIASQMLPRLFSDGSQMVPRCFPDGSQMVIGSQFPTLRTGTLPTLTMTSRCSCRTWWYQILPSGNMTLSDAGWCPCPESTMAQEP